MSGNIKKKIIISIIAIVVIAIIVIGGIFLKNILEEYNIEEVNQFSYFTLYQNQKYGVIDTKGNIIVEAKYDKVAIPNPSKPVFICYYDYNSQEDSYSTKVYNEKNEEIFSQYEQVLPLMFQDSTAKVPYEKSVLKYKENGKYGIMDFEGKKITKAQYTSIESLLYKEGYLIVGENDKYGIIDLEKNEKVGFIYNSISYNEKSDLYVAEKEDFTNDILDNTFEVKQSGILIDLNTDKGYIELRQGDDYNYFDLKLSNKKASEIFTSRTLFVDKKDGKYGFVDKDGNVIVDYIYDDATEQNEYGFAAVKQNGLWGSINSEGKNVIEPKYNLDNNLLVDFIGKWHLCEDVSMNYYCER